MLKYLKNFFLFMLCYSSIQCENCSYPDLLKRCDEEQIAALQEASSSLGLKESTQFQSLEGGLTRAQLYSFSIEGRKHVLRFLALGPSQPKEMRQNEIQAMKIGNDLGIAPRCVFSDENAVLMIMPFIEGSSFQRPDDSHLAQLGKMVRTLHDFSGDYPMRYSFKEKLNRHYQKGIKTGIAYPTGFDKEIQAVLDKPCICQVVPSHGDLNPSNILVGAHGIHIIDWTGATWDNPFADLSYFCLLSNLSSFQEAIFLEAYFGRAPSESEYQMLEEEKAKVYLLTAAIWFRFSETLEERSLPLGSRIVALDQELQSSNLKSAQSYLQEGMVVNLKTASKSAIKSYALSFYKAYLEAQSAYNIDLIAELKIMREKDQKIRFEVMKSDQLAFEQEKIDQEHFLRLKAIIEEFGWPGFRMVGEEGSDTMFLLVQHCADLGFQEQCLQLLKDAVAKGDASKKHLAYLMDRVLVRNGKTQIYGTQAQIIKGELIFAPIEDPENLDSVREEMGLGSFAEYRSFFKEVYHLEK